jgi:hypothetical protein
MPASTIRTTPMRLACAAISRRRSVRFCAATLTRLATKAQPWLSRGLSWELISAWGRTTCASASPAPSLQWRSVQRQEGWRLKRWELRRGLTLLKTLDKLRFVLFDSWRPVVDAIGTATRRIPSRIPNRH